MWRKPSLLRDALLEGRPHVENLGRMEMGAGVVVSSRPITTHLATGPRGVLHIGDRVRIAHGVSIHAEHDVRIDDDVDVGPFVAVLDFDFHEIADRDRPGAARPIRIGRGVRLGPGVVVLRGAVVGDGAIIAANSVVSRYIPAGARASGVPARPQP